MINCGFIKRSENNEIDCVYFGFLIFYLMIILFTFDQFKSHSFD